MDKALIRRWRERAARLYTDERGAEGLEKLLIIGAIVLPLLGILLYFKDTIFEQTDERVDDVFEATESDIP